MNKIISVIVLVLLYACSKDEPKEVYSFRNSTSYNVLVSPDQLLLEGTPNFVLNLAPGQSTNYESEYMYSIFQVNSDETDLNFAYKFNENTRVIYSFEKMVKYKITGTASSADLTYSDAGGTHQRTVSLPYEIGYDYFSEKYQYISAQNNGGYGAVRVEIYFEDRLVASDFCDGSFCIATAESTY